MYWHSVIIILEIRVCCHFQLHIVLCGNYKTCNRDSLLFDSLQNANIAILHPVRCYESGFGVYFLGSTVEIIRVFIFPQM